jgi:hypothetical protein
LIDRLIAFTLRQLWPPCEDFSFGSQEAKPGRFAYIKSSCSGRRAKNKNSSQKAANSAARRGSAQARIAVVAARHSPSGVPSGRVALVGVPRDKSLGLQFGHLQRFLTAARLGFNISGGGGLNH